jgi:hypothetical protein
VIVDGDWGGGVWRDGTRRAATGGEHGTCQGLAHLTRTNGKREVLNCRTRGSWETLPEVVHKHRDWSASIGSHTHSEEG